MSIRDLGVPKTTAQLDSRYVNETDAAPLALAGQTPSQAPVAPTPAGSVGSLAFTARAEHAHPSASVYAWCGTGGDGAATFDGTANPAGTAKISANVYRLTRDVNYSSLSGSAGVSIECSGFALLVNGTLAGPSSGTFTITSTPAPASGTNNGTAGWHFPQFNGRGITQGVGVAGPNGATGNGATGGSFLDSQIPTGNAGVGGAGATGTAGAVTTTGANSGVAGTAGRFHVATTGLMAGLDANLPTTAKPAMVLGGNAGGAGGGDGTNVGGGGGTGGNVVIVNARKVTGNVNVTAPGGAGGSPTTGNCGGGGGGTGGWAVLNSTDLTGWTGAASALGGAAGTGSGTGAAGAAGAAGVAQSTTWT